MSKAVQCDRCGKFEGTKIPIQDRNRVLLRGPEGWEEITLSYDINTDILVSCSLCPDCAKGLHAYLGKEFSQ